MKYAFIFPGQGSQSLGMGKDFVNNFKVARELLENASDILKINMNNILMDDEEKLNKTEYTQPSIFLVSAMAYYILQQEYDIKPFIAFGHSLGEVSAYCLSGGANFKDSIILTHKRGYFMSKACEGKEVGMMVCIGLSANKLEVICKEAQENNMSVWAANYNIEGQIVLAGIKHDLENISETLKNAGARRTLLLKMNVASHCPLLLDSISPFNELLQNIIKDSEVDIISNATLKLYKTKQDALINLTQQLVQPVLYNKSVLKAIELGVEKFIEFGNGNVLAGLNNKISNIPTISINSTESLKLIG